MTTTDAPAQDTGTTTTMLQAGQRLPSAAWPLLAKAGVTQPAAGDLLHLQLRRFAGCPVCDLHLRTFVRRKAELDSAGVEELAVFHSTEAELRAYTHDLPFDTLADPTKALYRLLGAEASARAVLSPGAWSAMARGVGASLARSVTRGRRPPPVAPTGGITGLPADFLIDSDGRLVATKYGTHANDQWTFDEVLALARR